MKKLFFLFIALGFVFANNTLGQAADATVSLPVLAKPAGDIEVPLNVDFTLEPVCNFQFYIHFDETELTFKGITNEELVGIFVSPAGSPSPVLISWFAPVLDDEPQPANLEGKLLDIKFEYQGDNYAEIGFVVTPPNDSSVGDCVQADDYAVVVFSDGSVSLAPPVPLSNWAVLIGLGLILAFVIIKIGRFF